jgi:hypothetical protein
LTSIPSPANLLDDCSFGCADISSRSDLKRELAVAIDDYIKEGNLPYVTGFDWLYLLDLEEGIWPVKVTCEDSCFGTNVKDMSAVLFVGNCD